uniref:Sulfatase N-terminal domain-containing protein n=1 Tax=Chaetoceros debilis TaxID=122233 RepID=A0A7S3VEY3_9STRA
MCRLPEVQSHCMLTCGGSCCVDDDIFEFPMIWGDNQQRCEFITKNTKQLWKRRQTYCEGNGNGNGATETDSEKIRSMCPNACNLTCDETGKPVLVPTTSPPPPNNPKPPTNNNNNNNGRPNILLILADDVGTGDVYTMDKVQMPNLNALMGKGIKFTDAHSTPLCAPSRYMLLSGNYPHRGRNPNGTWNMIQGDTNQFMDGQVSIAQVLKESGGYDTFMAGKYHIGGRVPLKPGAVLNKNNLLSDDGHDWNNQPLFDGPQDIGFGKSYMTDEGIQGGPYSWFRNGYLEGRDEVVTWQVGDHVTASGGTSIILNSNEGVASWDSTLYNQILVKETEEFMEEHLQKRPGDPMFMYVALGSVHEPHSPPVSYIDGQPVAGVHETGHLDLLAEMDMVVGSLVDMIEKKQLAEDTIIIFASDNGGLGKRLGSDEYGHDSNGILRGAKGTIYEGGSRIPMIMRHDGTIPPNETSDSLVGLSDVYATVCDIAGVSIPNGSSTVDSVSFANITSSSYGSNTNVSIVRKSFMTFDIGNNFVQGESSLRMEKYKLIRKYWLSNQQSQSSSWVVKNELYDLDKDIGETNDLINDSKRVGMLAEMMGKLRRDGPYPKDPSGSHIDRYSQFCKRNVFPWLDQNGL